ncbi:MAG: ester cyclase [Candidatus Heimdallarchaeota archaeon]|nr:ester cyclase [Candidatus Heimdallarchaeota archaeon]
MDYNERDAFFNLMIKAINDVSGNWDELKLQDFIEIFFEEDAVWIPATYHPENNFKGHQEVMNYWMRTTNAFPDFHMKILDSIHNLNKSWMYLDSYGTHLGDFLTIKATGNKINYEQIVIFTFGQNSKIKEVKMLNDSLAIFQQIGQAIIKNDNQLQINQYLNSLRSIGLLPQNE